LEENLGKAPYLLSYVYGIIQDQNAQESVIMTNQEANQYISKHLNDIGSALHSYGHFKYNIQDLNT